MKKLYITRKATECLMAFVMFEAFLCSLWFVVEYDHWVVKVLMGQFGIAALAMCWVFLFQMSGSRERREAAERKAA